MGHSESRSAVKKLAKRKGFPLSRLLLELEIDAACWEFVARRIAAYGGPPQPQPIVTYLDAAPDEDWDGPPETFIEHTTRVLGRMGL